MDLGNKLQVVNVVDLEEVSVVAEKAIMKESVQPVKAEATVGASA